MATLLNNNASGVAIIDKPTGVQATPYNFISLYDYAKQYQPELLPQLTYVTGSGDLTGILEVMGGTATYASDSVKWAEMGRLHAKLQATIATNTFTTTSKHGLRPDDIILVIDPTAHKESTAVVTSITSDTTFVALNREGDDWTDFTNSVTISRDFSNSFKKGSETFDDGKKWDPVIKENFTHIIKEVYEVPNSDVISTSWVDCGGEKKWFSVEVERSRTLFRNKVTLTHLFNQRNTTSAAALAGHPPGMKGAIQQIEVGGNLLNGYIQNQADLENIAFRAVQQNPNVKEYLVLANMAQMNYFNTLAASVSPNAVGAANYGSFTNGHDMAIYLDFKSIYISGITFHFKYMNIFDNPEAYGFNTAGVAYIIMPGGRKEMQLEGNKKVMPYFNVLYREQGGYSRKDEVKLFGVNGAPLSKDVTRYEFLSETTNVLVGANSWFVGRKQAGHYTYG